MGTLLMRFVSARYYRKTDAGGWINLVLARPPQHDTSTTNIPFGAGTKFESRKGKESTHNPSAKSPGELLESRIAELAEQLGVQPKELASAIKPLVPPAKASALDSHPEATGTLVDVLVENARETGGSENGGLGLGNVVGMDEPPSDLAVD
jgi:hypothetical protein